MIERDMHFFRLIGKIQKALSQAEHAEEALRLGMKIMIENSAAEYGVLWYLGEGGLLHPYYWLFPEDFTGVSHVPGEDLIGKVFSDKRSQVISDFPHHPETADMEIEKRIHTSSMVVIPVAISEKVTGVLEMIKTGENVVFSPDDVDVMEILALSVSMTLSDMNLPPKNWQEAERILSARDIVRDFQNGDRVTRVLNGVNLDIYKGEFLAILGESGCGKSTFLNIIGGMDQATSGSFTFMGKDMTHASEKELTYYRRENIGFIFQSYNLMPNLNAMQNLDLIGELVENPMDSREALRIVKLEDHMDQYPSQLSGGQQQRVSIARALMKRPQLILADEPTAALDYTTSIEVLSVLEDVIRTGATLVMVTHNEEITKMANRVVRMRNGRMHEVTVNHQPCKATDLVW